MLISIIIPVFNSERYLERCLDSVLGAMKSIDGEILTIDNGSTDGSVEILKEYQKQNKQIKILHCDTPGAAAVRNYGAKNAKGDYIWFVDADDAVAADSVELLTKKAKKEDADLVMLGVERIYKNGGKNYLSAVTPGEKNYKSRFVRYGMGPVQVLIRRKWWDEHGFKFMEGHIHEDMELMSSLILYTEKFAAVDQPLYYYYQNEGSVLHKTTWDPHYFDIFPVLKSMYQRFEDTKATKTYHDELEWFFIWNLLIDSAADFKKFPEGKAGLKRSREMMKEYFPNWRKNRFLKEKPVKLRIRVRLNYYS